MNPIQGLLAAAIFLTQAAFAPSTDSYPGRPVKIIVPFSAGSASDTVARITTAGIEKQ